MIDFLNKCIELAPQAVTALLDEKSGAVEKMIIANEGVQAIRNKVGKVVGFEAMPKPKPKKTAPKKDDKKKDK